MTKPEPKSVTLKSGFAGVEAGTEIPLVFCAESGTYWATVGTWPLDYHYNLEDVERYKEAFQVNYKEQEETFVKQVIAIMSENITTTYEPAPISFCR